MSSFGREINFDDSLNNHFSHNCGSSSEHNETFEVDSLLLSPSRRDYERLRLSLAQVTSEFEAFRKQQQDRNLSSNNSVKDLERVTSENRKLKLELENAIRNTQQLQKERASLEYDIKLLNEEFIQNSNIREQEMSELLQLRRLLSEKLATSSSADIFSDMYNASIKKYETLMKDHNDLRKNYSRCTLSENSLRQKLSVLEKDIDSIQKKHNDLKLENEHLLSERNGLRQQYTSAVRAYERVQHEKESCISKQRNFQEQLELVLKECEQLMFHKSKLCKELSRLTNERNSAVQEYTLVMSERDQVHLDIEKLTDSLEAAESDRQQLTSEIEKLNEEVERLQAQTVHVTEFKDNLLDAVSRFRDSVCNGIESKECERIFFDIFQPFLEESNSSFNTMEAYCVNNVVENLQTDVFQLQTECDDFRNTSIELERKLNLVQLELSDVKKQRDWTFSERDNIVHQRDDLRIERESIEQGDPTVSQLPNTLKTFDGYYSDSCQSSIRRKISGSNGVVTCQTANDNWLSETVVFTKQEGNIHLTDLGLSISVYNDNNCDDIVDEKRFVISEVKADSPAKDQIKILDYISHVNGKDVKHVDLDDLEQIINASGSTLTFKINRMDSLYNLSPHSKSPFKRHDVLRSPLIRSHLKYFSVPTRRRTVTSHFIGHVHCHSDTPQRPPTAHNLTRTWPNQCLTSPSAKNKRPSILCFDFNANEHPSSPPPIEPQSPVQLQEEEVETDASLQTSNFCIEPDNDGDSLAASIFEDSKHYSAFESPLLPYKDVFSNSKSLSLPHDYRNRFASNRKQLHYVKNRSRTVSSSSQYHSSVVKQRSSSAAMSFEKLMREYSGRSTPSIYATLQRPVAVKAISSDGVEEPPFRKDRLKPSEPRLVYIEKSSEPLGISILAHPQGGIFVSHVADDSIAASAGLEVGDQLLEFNAINLRTATYEQADIILRHQGTNLTILTQYKPEKIIECASGQSSSIEGPSHSSNHTRQNSSVSYDSSVTGPNDLLSTYPRVVTISRPENGFFGFCLTGGNNFGIFVTHVTRELQEQSGSEGLQQCDQLLKINEVDLSGSTIEEVYLLLRRVPLCVQMIAQYSYSRYKAICRKPGDCFYVRTCFERKVSPDCGLSFHSGIVLLIDDSMVGGTLGTWHAWILDSQGDKTDSHGSVPSQYLLQKRWQNRCSHYEFMSDCPTLPHARQRNRRSLFRKKKAYELLPCTPAIETVAYERVSLLEVPLARPVVLRGPLVACFMSRLLNDHPTLFTQPEVHPGGKGTLPRAGGHSYNLEDIKALCDKGVHPLLNLSKCGISILCKACLHPIVIVFKPKNYGHLRDLRDSVYLPSKLSHRQAKLIYNEAKLEPVITVDTCQSITVTGSDFPSIIKEIVNGVKDVQRRAQWIPLKDPPLISSLLMSTNY